jgi:serine/threonine protein kinase
MATPTTSDFSLEVEELSRLGAGSFGQVWLVRDRALNVLRALKIVTLADIHDPTDFYSEPRALKDLQHERIVSVVAAGKSSDSLYILMEYLPDGSSEALMADSFVPLRRAVGLAADVCWALQFAHSNHYVHRDIKPANILIGPDGRGKLSDFGLATRAPSGPASPFGYVTHLAPEVFTHGLTDPLTDVYAVGVTLYRMINGDSYLGIPAGADHEELICAGKFPNRVHYRAFVPRPLRTVVNRAMNPDRDRRYASAAELRAALEQVSIRCDWTEVRNPAVVTWIASGDDFGAEVTLKDRGAKHAVEVRRSVGGGKLRSIRADCVKQITPKQALQRATAALQRLTTYGR